MSWTDVCTHYIWSWEELVTVEMWIWPAALMKPSGHVTAGDSSENPCSLTAESLLLSYNILPQVLGNSQEKKSSKFHTDSSDKNPHLFSSHFNTNMTELCQNWWNYYIQSELLMEENLCRYKYQYIACIMSRYIFSMK